MGFVILILLTFFSHSVFCQNVTPFDFLEASKAMNKSNMALNKINGTFGGQKEKNCTQILGPQGEGILSCSVRESDFDDSVILKIDYSPSTFPAEIKQQMPLEFIKFTEKKNVSCVFRFNLDNDNQQMLGRIAEQQVKNASYGDDFGKTHGLAIGISCISADGLSSAYTYSTELYSDPDRMSGQREASGNVSMKQKFTSENIFSLIQDNINQNKVTYWKKGIGFINTSEKKKWGFLQSTGQQEGFMTKLIQLKKVKPTIMFMKMAVKIAGIPL